MKLLGHETDISVIIVNYNSGLFLMKCIHSILENVKVKYEIIIVDNNSSDNSLKFLENEYNTRNIRVIINEHNLGFARANNIGAENATGKYLHFLNPDTQLTESINNDYLKILSENKDYIYVHRLSNLDKSIEQSRNLLPLISNYFHAIFSRSKAIYWYTGATVIISIDDYRKIGGWSEDYFMYIEDMDLFYKASIKNIKTVEIDNPIIHIGKGSTSNVWSTYEREVKVQKSFKIFYLKYNKRFEYYVIKIITLLYVFFKSPAKALLILKIGLAKNDS